MRELGTALDKVGIKLPGYQMKQLIASVVASIIIVIDCYCVYTKFAVWVFRLTEMTIDHIANCFSLLRMYVQ